MGWIVEKYIGLWMERKKGILKMMKSFDLSVIILVYKSEKYIEEVLMSLLKQSDNNFEIVIVNNASTDTSMGIVDDFMKDNPDMSQRTRIINLEQNIGCGQGRRMGFEAAIGKYIVYVDSDDTVAECFVADLLEKVHTNADIITFGRNNVNDSGDKIWASIFPYTNKRKAKCYLDHFSKYCFKKQLVVDNKIKFSEGTIGEDREFAIHLTPFIRSLEAVQKCIYNYRCNSSSTTQNANYELILHGKELVFRAYGDAYPLLNSLADKHASYIRAYAYYLYSRGSLEEPYKKKLSVLFYENYLKRIKAPIVPFLALGDRENRMAYKQILKDSLKN